MTINRKLLNLIYLIIGALAVIFAGINHHMIIPAWIAPIALLLFTRSIKWKTVWIFIIVIAVCGGLSQSGNNLMNIPAVHAFNSISFAILYSLPFIIDKLLYKKGKPFYYSLIFPVSIALVEYFASFIIGTWGSIAHTQYTFKAFMQIASITGIYGIWFTVSWLASTINWIIENKNNKSGSYKAILIYSSLFFLILIYGQKRINANANEKGIVKVAAVLSDNNIHALVANESSTFKNLAMGGSIKIPTQLFSDSTLINSLISRTKKAINNGSNIVVWNETSLIVDNLIKQKVLSEIKTICIEYDAYILLSFIEESSVKDKKPFNNISVLVSPNGKIEWEYKKSYLEQSAEALIVNAGDFNLPVIETKYGKIGNVICADLDMQHYMKQAGEKNIDLLLVPGFDWEGITPLHSQMASIQAIQFGCNILRSNGLGISAAYNYKGQEIASLNSLNSDNKILYADIPIGSANTIYNSIGDLFILLCLGFLLIIIAKALLNKKQR